MSNLLTFLHQWCQGAILRKSLWSQTHLYKGLPSERTPQHHFLISFMFKAWLLLPWCGLGPQDDSLWMKQLLLSPREPSTVGSRLPPSLPPLRSLCFTWSDHIQAHIGSKLNKLKAKSVQSKVLQKDKMEYFVMVHTCNPSSQGAEAGRQQAGSHARLCKEWENLGLWDDSWQWPGER